MPRVRFTVRGMMIAVAILAVMACVSPEAVQWIELSRRYRAEALHHRLWAEEFERGVSRNMAARPARRRVADEDRRMAVWERAAEAKYARLARYPWLPVSPDPPEPK